MVDEDRLLAVEHSQVRADEADIRRPGHLVEICEQRLLVRDVDDDVGDHARIVSCALLLVIGPMVPVAGPTG